MNVLSQVQPFSTLWTVACQAPLSMGLFRQEYWSGFPCPPPGDLPNPGMATASPALAGGFFITEPPEESSGNRLLLLLSHVSRVRLCVTHRRQPTRLPRSWDSPGKNTGVGCHFLLQCMRVKSESEGAQSCPTLCDPMDCSLPDSSFHGIS